MSYQSWKRSAVAIAETLTTLLTMDVRDLKKVGMYVEVADQALDQFTVDVKYHEDAGAVTIASAGTDYTTPADRILNASGNLTAISAGGNGWLEVDVDAVATLVISCASANVAGSAVTAHAHGQ